VRLLGIAPADPQAGAETERGQANIGVPAKNEFEALIRTDDYPKSRQLQVFNFNAGLAGSDPTAKVFARVVALRALSEKAAPGGKLIIMGYSLGGRNAATLAQRLTQAKVPISYLALLNAAFNNSKDPAASTAVSVEMGDSFAFLRTNELVPDDAAAAPTIEKPLPGFEVRAHVPGCGTRPFDGQKFFEDERTKYEAEKKRIVEEVHPNLKMRQLRRTAEDYFFKVHAEAIRLGYSAAQGKAVRLLHGKSE
jgi:dienelactone hydrolase